MRRFEIRPINPQFVPVEIIAHDAATVLHLVHRMGCGEADIARDGAYAFSVRLEGDGYWCISQRGPFVRPVQKRQVPLTSYRQVGSAGFPGQRLRLAP
jgi:hypothetical protein